MHISEGIIVGIPAAAYTIVAAGIVGIGAKKMKEFAAEHPEKKPLLGMAGAFIFFLSLIPIPAFTGTTSHPCGSPLAGIILGPWIGIALTGLSLLLQAAFFAHGGFSTWGANVVTLGVGGAFFGWLAFRIARRLGFPLVVAGAIGGLAGDIMTYVFAGLSLSAVLSIAPSPKYTFVGYLSAIYIAYIPTQGPIAIGEMLITGLLLHHVYNQRPEILNSLKVTSSVLMVFMAILFFSSSFVFAQENNQYFMTAEGGLSVENPESESVYEGVIGMDEAVNEKFAEDAGIAPRAPYINIEALGDLWNTAMLSGGAICGFIIGRWWHLLSGKKSEKKRRFKL